MGCNASKTGAANKSVAVHLGGDSGKDLVLPAAPARLEANGRFSHQWIKVADIDIKDDGTVHHDFLYAGCWDAPSPKQRRAVVVFCHGLTSHIHNLEYEENLYRHLTAAGVVLFGYDMRGHGRTGEASGNKYDICQGEQRMDDLSKVIKTAHKKFPELPLFLLGHSVGGAECLAFVSQGFAAKGILKRYDMMDHIAGVAVVAPYLGHNDFVNSLVVSIMAHLAPSTAIEFDGPHCNKGDYSKDAADLGLSSQDTEAIFRKYDTSGSGSLEPDELMKAFNHGLKLDLSEKEVAEVMKRFDDSGDGSLSIEEFIGHVASHPSVDKYSWPNLPVSALEALQYYAFLDTPESAECVNKPLLWIHGKKDKINPYEPVKDFVEALGTPTKTSHLYDDLRHGVFMDTDAEKVCKDLVRWVGARVDAGVAAKEVKATKNGAAPKEAKAEAKAEVKAEVKAETKAPTEKVKRANALPPLKKAPAV
jgi:alpha-beta hydrolase superfamily lysophospholipase